MLELLYFTHKFIVSNSGLFGHALGFSAVSYSNHTNPLFNTVYTSIIKNNIWLFESNIHIMNVMYDIWIMNYVHLLSCPYMYICIPQQVTDKASKRFKIIFNTLYCNIFLEWRIFIEISNTHSFCQTFDNFLYLSNKFYFMLCKSSIRHVVWLLENNPNGPKYVGDILKMFSQ